MWRAALDDLRCPKSGSPLELAGEVVEDPPGHVLRGELVATEGGAVYPIHEGIPRFVDSEQYTSSFGYQWNLHRQTQLDKYNGTTLSRDRFFATTDWPRDLTGQKVLEAGCGAGRFSQIALDAGATLYSFDLSTAVDANRANNGPRDGFFLAQASVYDMPFAEGLFDRVFCMGVLQYTPDPRRTFHELVRFVKPGGHLAVDVYPASWRTPFVPRYLLRPLTKRVPKRTFYRMCQVGVPPLAWLRSALLGVPLVGRPLHTLVPVASYRKSPLAEQLSAEQLREWEILDTFDVFSPELENPQRAESLRAWAEEAGLLDIQVGPAPNGFRCVARRPESAAEPEGTRPSEGQAVPEAAAHG